MTVHEFIRIHGCRCAEATDSPSFKLSDGTSVQLLPMLHVSSSQWRDEYSCRVTCSGCNTTATTTERLEGAM